jgi:hypothetical protein
MDRTGSASSEVEQNADHYADPASDAELDPERDALPDP